MASVRIVDIKKSLDRNLILKGISLEIADGELVVLVGPSGCGKSTLLRTLAGLETPDSGKIWIGDRRVETLEPRDRNIAMVFQNYALYPHMNVRSNLAFALRLRGEDEAKIDTRVKEVAAMLGIDGLLARYPRQLSGGQRQRVAMGRALVREADVFLLDEPLSNLDAALRTQTRVEIKRVHTRLDATMIYVTHDQVEAMTLADKLVVLRAGEIMQVGSPAELYDRPANTFVATFLGSPPMNLVKCEVDGARIRSEAVNLPCPPSAREHSKVIVGLRPHDLVAALDELGTEGASATAPTEAEGTVQATVDAIEPLGWDANVHFQVAGEKVIARFDAPVARRLSEGQKLGLRVPAAAVHVFDAKTEKALSHGD
ncbi:MAG TPA: sn-glycerol-3-phosphate ABC transporter ATP-binding protein UgpC [Polyangiaceae bacterium]|nr:sn-glycerol-3-phosphate ABC transporter ATP-binding protein UgpC [Polyangiaceae bacterium]